MTKKIIALDLDGTLLRSDSSLSDYTISTVKKVAEKGHQIIIATGRPYRMALDYYQQLGLTTPMINFNGSLTHIPGQKWAFEHSATIDKKLVLELLAQMTAFELDFLASEYPQHFYLAYDDVTSIDPTLFGVEEISPKMTLDASKITRNPNALLMQTRHSNKYELAKEMKAHLNHEIEVDSWGGPRNILECSPKGVHKAYALKYLLGVLNLAPDQLIAFGDEHNDTEMLAYAHQSYAMKNANPLLLDYAKEQLPLTNDEDGVAKKLEELFL